MAEGIVTEGNWVGYNPLFFQDLKTQNKTQTSPTMFQSKPFRHISPPSPAGEVVLLVLFAHALVQHPGVSHLKPEPSPTSRIAAIEPPEDVCTCLHRPSLEAMGEHGCTGNLTKR